MIKKQYIPYWITNQGKHIAVDDMTEEHVRNALKLICKNQSRIAFRSWIDMKNGVTNNIESNFKEEEIQSLDDHNYFDHI